MRHFNGKQGLKRSQFAKEIRSANLEKVLIVPIDVSKVLQKAMMLNYFGEPIEPAFSFSGDRIQFPEALRPRC